MLLGISKTCESDCEAKKIALRTDSLPSFYLSGVLMSPDQVRVCFTRMVGSSTGSLGIGIEIRSIGSKNLKK